MADERMSNAEQRITRVETELVAMQDDINEIKLHVSNHLPTSLREISGKVEELTHKETKRRAVKEFLSNGVLVISSLLGLTWGFVKILQTVGWI